jgi:hypothetical protein
LADWLRAAVAALSESDSLELPAYEFFVPDLLLLSWRLVEWAAARLNIIATIVAEAQPLPIEVAVSGMAWLRSPALEIPDDSQWSESCTILADRIEEPVYTMPQGRRKFDHCIVDQRRSLIVDP